MLPEGSVSTNETRPAAVLTACLFPDLRPPPACRLAIWLRALEAAAAVGVAVRRVLAAVGVAVRRVLAAVGVAVRRFHAERSRPGAPVPLPLCSWPTPRVLLLTPTALNMAPDALLLLCCCV